MMDLGARELAEMHAQTSKIRARIDTEGVKTKLSEAGQGVPRVDQEITVSITLETDDFGAATWLPKLANGLIKSVAQTLSQGFRIEVQGGQEAENA
jgi:D-serine deaminase-like pyridoxal phosphate-dependent protein